VLQTSLAFSNSEAHNPLTLSTSMLGVDFAQ
jgi:hypothetical protein